MQTDTSGEVFRSVAKRFIDDYKACLYAHEFVKLTQEQVESLWSIRDLAHPKEKALSDAFWDNLWVNDQEETQPS